MDEKPIDLADKINNNSKQTKEVNATVNNSSKASGVRNTIKVPKQEAVVSVSKHLKKSDENQVNRQLEKQKRNYEKEKLQKLQQEQKLLNEKAKQQAKIERQLSAKTKEEKQKEKELLKEQKQKEKQAAKKQKEKQKRKEKLAKLQQKKDYGLDSLETIEDRILRRKEDEEERKRKKIIIILIILLIAMISVGSFAAIKIVDDLKPEPVTVEIIIETKNIDSGIPIDPDNPDAGYYRKIVYPGDTINVEFYVSNTAVTESFPVFVRFRAYIIIEDLTEHSVFIPTFKDATKWYSLTDDFGNNVVVDDWFYYGGYLETGVEHKIQILESLMLSTDLDNKYQGQEFTLVLAIEAIEGNLEALGDFEEWYEAVVPADWLAYMQSLDVPA